tara:strand:- start:296 stop:472 length:177 start_codon:yes stop_codon:yes gene_type:complete
MINQAIDSIQIISHFLKAGVSLMVSSFLMVSMYEIWDFWIFIVLTEYWAASMSASDWI